MAKKKSKKNKIELCSDFKLFDTSVKRDYGIDALIDANVLIDPEPNISGSLGLDVMLRVPFPQGRIIEIFGPEGSSKTSLGLEILGQAQSAGKRVAYVRAEKNLNRYLLENITSIDLTKKDDDGNPTFVLLKGQTGERNLELTEMFAASWKDCVIVVDSVDALVPEAALEGAVGDSHVGLLSRLMSAACRKLDTICEQSGATVIFINQQRANIGAYGGGKTTSGGNGLPYYASQRIELFKIRNNDYIIDKHGKKIGHNIRYMIRKNKLGPPQTDIEEIPILYGKGIFTEKEVAESLKDLALVDTCERGLMVKIEDTLMYPGAAAQFFLENSKIFTKYHDKVMDVFNEK